MAMHNEMMMQDAAAGVGTTYSFEPVNGRYLARHGNNTFDGTLDPAMGDSDDWVAIELQAGRVYTITVAGMAMDPDGTPGNDDDVAALPDPILTVYDDKGGMVDMNDDNPDNMAGQGIGDLSSKLVIGPLAEDGTYYISVSAFEGNPGSPNAGAYRVMVVESNPIPANVGKTIPGTAGNDKITGTDLDDTINGNDGDDAIYGGEGNDTLRGGVDNVPSAASTDDPDDVDDTAPAGEQETGGNDLLVGGPGADVLWGGDGEDTISYKYSMEGVHVNLMTGIARGGEAGGDSFGNPNAERYTNDIENVQGSMYDDDITGDAMGNKLWGYDGDDELTGGDGDDTLNGGMGNDDLSGGDDTDTLIGGPGADMLTGGMGMDTASYMGSMMGVTVRLHASQAVGGDAEGDTFEGTVTYKHTVIEDEDEPPVDTESTAPDIEHLTGSGMNDILAGDGRANTIMGGAGDDKIYGGPGGDASTNTDTLHGGDGNDMLFGGIGADTLNGDKGDDMLVGGPGADTYDGGEGNDMIYADLADVTGRTGTGATAPFQGGENPTGVPGVMPDSDTVSFARFTDEDGGVTVALDGSIYTNIENIIGTAQVDSITGDGEANIIEGGDSGDTLDGGAGEDTLSYASSDKRVRADLALNSYVGGHANGDNVTDDSFENLIGSAFNDVLTGDENANKLTGGDGDDELSGAAGDDTLSGGAGEDDLSGGAGDDTLEGGAGADELDGGDDPAPTAGTAAEQSAARSTAAAAAANTLSYAGSNAGVSVNLTTAKVSGGHAQGDEIAVYEDVDHDNDEAIDNTPDDDNSATLEETDTPRIEVSSFRHATGSDHNDSITGDYRMNILNGMGGDDNIRGGLEWDMLTGGPGADRLDGGESGGVMDEDDPTNNRAEDVDWAVYRKAMGGVSVNLHTMMGTGGDAEGDRLIDIELVWGSEDMENGDMFIAGAGADMLHGDFGPDTLSYEASGMGVYVDLSTQPAWDDTDSPTNEIAGAPADATSPGQGTPTDDLAPAIAMASAITETGGTVTPTATTDPEENINGAAGDRIGGIQNLTGSAHNDFLVGDAANNTLMGGAGDDFLSGAAGMDTLNGGDGKDRLLGGDDADTLMGGDGNDDLEGGVADDSLNGGDGHDELDGGGGADKITGGAGDDELTGGSEADEFIFAQGNGFDYVVDFADNEDKIDLSAFEDITSIEDLNIRDQGTSVVIDLEAHGGGRITLQSIQLADEALQGTAGSTGLDNGDFIFA